MGTGDSDEYGEEPGEPEEDPWEADDEQWTRPVIDPRAERYAGTGEQMPVHLPTEDYDDEEQTLTFHNSQETVIHADEYQDQQEQWEEQAEEALPFHITTGGVENITIHSDTDRDTHSARSTIRSTPHHLTIWALERTAFPGNHSTTSDPQTGRPIAHSATPK